MQFYKRFLRLRIFQERGCSMGGFIQSVKLFFHIWKDKEFRDNVERLKSGVFYELPQILALFQREGRFIDFLLEDIGVYQDAQIGSVARSVHQGCQRVFREYITVEPILKEKEGSEVTVPEGFDPQAVRIVGNVKGTPPFRGTLAHHGWKLSAAKIPSIPKSHDHSIIAPAEVEI